MAVRWSSDFIFADHKDIKAKCIALDCTGNYLLLPGKTQLGIKNLNISIDDIITFPKMNKNEPETAAWNPHFCNKDLCAISCGTQVEILIWKNNTELRTNTYLKSHTRVINSINWHPMDSNLIVSTALDTYTYIWDIREPKKPAISLSSFAPASHVKWNKISHHLLATAHGGDVKIWDGRKASTPVQYISAHLTSIHCLDWCPSKENQICTGSQDGIIKFFDISLPRKTEFFIHTEAPVWKSCYTPFGRGMLAVIIPTNRKTDNTLLLWNLSNNNVPVHTFVGHTEIVLDFQWRLIEQNGSDFQLITWSKDQTLRIWEVDKYLQELCNSVNHDLELNCADYISSCAKEEIDLGVEVYSSNFGIFQSVEEVEKCVSSSLAKENYIKSSGCNSNNGRSEMNLRKDFSTNELAAALDSNLNISNSCKSSTITTVNPVNLQQEFSLNINIPNVQIHKTDIIRRMCYTSAKCNGQVISLLINFPPSYPRNRSPIFRFAQGTTVSNIIKFKILEALRDTADFKVKNNQACLEACLRTLVVTLQQLTANAMDKVNLFFDDRLVSDKISFGNQDSYFLSTRTCGAKFCFIDKLVCFAKPLSRIQSSDKNICGLVNLSYRQTETLTKLYLQNKNGTLPSRTKYIIRHGLLKKMENIRQNKRTVLVYSVSSLLYLNKHLAFKYVFKGDNIAAVCKHNASVANSVGRNDLYQIWNLVLLLDTPFATVPWEFYPLGRQMLQSIILYYVSQSDIQTAAMLCCIFRQYLCKSDSVQLKQKSCKSIVNAPSGSPYHTIHPTESSFETAWSFPTRKHIRSCSWSERVEDSKSSNNIENAEAVEINDISSFSTKMSFKEDNFELLYDRVKLAYADVLYRWQLLNVRATVIKYVKNAYIEMHKGIESIAECKQCKNSIAGKMCPNCKIPTLYCVICRLSVKGLASVCGRCGHGGHLLHMKKWFESEFYCPVGCKCQCSMEVISLFN